MKKLICLCALLCLAALPCLPAHAAMVDAHYIFGYVIDATMNTIEVISDEDQQLLFTTGDSTSIVSDHGVLIDDAVVIMYLGDLNPDAVQQAVTVSEITVLSSVYGTVTELGDGKMTISCDDDGQTYTFDTLNALVVEGEDGTHQGDQVEVSFKGRLDPQQAVQPVTYVHITVYGQTEDTAE